MSFDVVVVGSGPAGVSAGFPLVQAGVRVLMLDAGRRPEMAVPVSDRFSEFRSGPEFRRQLLGDGFEGLDQDGVMSPKFRLPGNRYAYAGFVERYGFRADGFHPVGSLARGGLSTIWGAGVAEFGAAELAPFPFAAAELGPSYREVGRRMGISGVVDDDLAGFLGTGIELQAPSPLGANAARLLCRYEQRRDEMRERGISMGRARNAVLTADHRGRGGCNRCGHCLWGCHRDSIYAAHHDLDALERFENFEYRDGVFVSAVESGGTPRLTCETEGGTEVIEADRVLLACGTLGSTALVLTALGGQGVELPLLSVPTAGFGLLTLAHLGRATEAEMFGLTQLTFTHTDPASGDVASSNLFEAGPVPIVDFAMHVDLLRPVARRVLGVLRPSMLVGNAFFSGAYSRHSIALGNDGRPSVRGGFADALHDRVARMRGAVSRAMRRCGAVLLPGSFKIGDPGTDVHYAGTLPMAQDPAEWQTGNDCEVAGLPGVHVVDGACIPALPAKAHTLTIMANADRVGRKLAG